MHEVDYLRTLAAFLAVLGAIGMGFWLLRRLEGRGGLKGWLSASRTAPGSSRRLAVVESRMLDAKTRLMLIRHDDAEHLIVLGQHGNLVLHRPDRHAADPA